MGTELELQADGHHHLVKRTVLEKVGVTALGAGVVLVSAVVLAPEVAAAGVGGALTATGAWFLRRGFRERR